MLWSLGCFIAIFFGLSILVLFIQKLIYLVTSMEELNQLKSDLSITSCDHDQPSFSISSMRARTRSQSQSHSRPSGSGIRMATRGHPDHVSSSTCDLQISCNSNSTGPNISDTTTSDHKRNLNKINVINKIKTINTNVIKKTTSPTTATTATTRTLAENTLVVPNDGSYILDEEQNVHPHGLQILIRSRSPSLTVTKEGIDHDHDHDHNHNRDNHQDNMTDIISGVSGNMNTTPKISVPISDINIKHTFATSLTTLGNNINTITGASYDGNNISINENDHDYDRNDDNSYSIGNHKSNNSNEIESNNKVNHINSEPNNSWTKNMEVLTTRTRARRLSAPEYQEPWIKIATKQTVLMTIDMIVIGSMGIVNIVSDDGIVFWCLLCLVINILSFNAWLSFNFATIYYEKFFCCICNTQCNKLCTFVALKNIERKRKEQTRKNNLNNNYNSTSITLAQTKLADQVNTNNREKKMSKKKRALKKQISVLSLSSRTRTKSQTILDLELKMDDISHDDHDY